ncbi:MAG: hypothetical protein COA79_02260 [Planctomycetota bacterium]|nr:MAG: hypothetical protein COA79_02260 [Planctomycetota bacterium]
MTKLKSNVIFPGMQSINCPSDVFRERFDIQNEQLVTSNMTIDFVFIGDDLVANWEPSVNFGRKQLLVINRGVAKETADFLKIRYEADAVQLKPNWILLSIGGNDLLKADESNGGTKLENVLGDIEFNIEEMVYMSQDARITGIIASAVPPFTKSHEASFLGKTIPKLNKRLKELSENHGSIYVDFYSEIVDLKTKCIRPEYEEDGGRMGTRGYEALTRIFRETLSKNGIQV